jgi:hypothetical protein
MTKEEINNLIENPMEINLDFYEKFSTRSKFIKENIDSDNVFDDIIYLIEEGFSLLCSALMNYKNLENSDEERKECIQCYFYTRNFLNDSLKLMYEKLEIEIPTTTFENFSNFKQLYDYEEDFSTYLSNLNEELLFETSHIPIFDISDDWCIIRLNKIVEILNLLKVFDEYL